MLSTERRSGRRLLSTVSTGQAFPCFRLARLYHDDDDDDDEDDDDDDDVEDDDNDGHHEVQAKSDRLIRIHIYTYRERDSNIHHYSFRSILQIEQASRRKASVVLFWRRASLDMSHQPALDGITESIHRDFESIDWHDGPGGNENIVKANNFYKRMFKFNLNGITYDGEWIGKGQHRNVYAVQGLDMKVWRLQKSPILQPNMPDGGVGRTSASMSDRS
jgi:hypothetical protein